ncbi:MAG: FecR domain-containing protein [Cyclobacteriaceae bacterium]|nr:FecR domain-containing protein [Cyclobacteriaceae bacterium]
MEKKDIIRILNELGTQQEVKAFKVWLDRGGFEEEFDKILGSELNEALKKAANDYKDEEIILLLSQLKKRIPELKEKKINQNIYNSWFHDVKLNNIWYTKIAATILAFVFSLVFVFTKIDPNRSVISEVAAVELIEKQTHNGQKLTVMLPDGSKVILNSSSILEYPADFDIGPRHVKLQGEAFFDVVHDPERSFVVNMDEIQVTVLGTSFNIYRRNHDVKIALTEGKVGILNEKDFNNYIELLPGEMASSVVSNGSFKLKVTDFDNESVTAWKDGKLTFKSKPLHEILQDLSKWYGVEFEYTGFVDLNRRVSGEFQNENLDNILRGITFTLGLKYKIDNKKVMVQSK